MARKDNVLPDEMTILQGDDLLRVLTEQHRLQPGVLGPDHKDGQASHVYVVSGLLVEI